MFNVGQKIVCIVDDDQWYTPYAVNGVPFDVINKDYPRYLAIYTVTGIDGDGNPYLAEVKNIDPFIGSEVSWLKDCFRPAVTKDTKAEVSKLKRLFNVIGHEVDV